jgi:hypothetical protein
VNVLADRRSNRGYCAACGKSFRNPQDSDSPTTCEDCGERREKGERIALLFAERRRHEVHVHLEERFGELFESAHVLLQEQACEDIVLPTLAMEGLIIRDGELGGWARVKRSLLQAWGDAEAWATEKAQLLERPGTVTPVRVIGSTVILERVPVVARVVRSGGRIEGIVIELTPGKPAEPEEAVEAYKRALDDAEISRYHERAASFDSVFNDYQLRIGVRPKQVHMGFGDEGAFPAPDIFREEFEWRKSGILGSRSGRTRAAGGPMAPDNSIPAVVAFYLRIFGQLKWTQVYRLLNQHVLRNTWKDYIPEDESELNYESRTRQLQRSVKAVRRHLVPVMRSLH